MMVTDILVIITQALLPHIATLIPYLRPQIHLRLNLSGTLVPSIHETVPLDKYFRFNEVQRLDQD